ncbi:MULTISPECIES: homocysteine S-methyltransferase family protein [unclassified Leisingera]|uniref:homocysteine S-methyltransferase family protein n=1 Tax=unclassified Leisingera TaxID=2614906 RepID=UPI0002D4D176|nr:MULTISPECIES: homocysteine S-methyltransferase family protein [unclassified Leisingera]KIC21372.1 homocysteine methyltransferase [Leisingera sp. ANG-S3]KIC24103.1 homocysteine methyltransferase [Leisingera sp. ANG-M6]KIC52079.1 homocysteine methyltransferase [Leisingera sp. ANG-S]KID09940.1 homocysteine methyltransferase [Leisingera sp. ANG1]
MKYRDALPQLNGQQMIADGGLETTLVFHEGISLPLFAAFMALETREGREAIARYMRGFADLAVRNRRGFVMDTPTWRASPRWAAELGVGREQLEAVHRTAVATLRDLRDALETPQSPFVINGVIGPHSDGYAPSEILTAEEAEAYHQTQVEWFAAMGADMVSAITMTYAEEAIGIVQAARSAAIPAVISFTVETDGRLPSGQSLRGAVEQVDAETGGAAAYFMINCAHPDHFTGVLAEGGKWTARIRGLRANASRLSHAELDEAEELDDGDPQEFGALHRDLAHLLPNLTVVGGCCGTDHRHVEHVCTAGRHAAAAAG